MPITIAILSQKGGTGKTTAVRTLADVLKRAGLRVLAVDLDPQGNLSDYFDVPPDAQPTTAEVLAGQATLAEAIRSTDAAQRARATEGEDASHSADSHSADAGNGHGRSDVVPANLSLAETELALGGKIGRELTLRRALQQAPDRYEIVLLDCPPSLGLLTVNALVAADWALITAEAQYFALQGVEQALEVIEVARDSLNQDLQLLGVLLNLADLRTVHSREALASLRERFGEKVFDTAIRASIAYAESAERAVSILDHRPDLAADYIALADEVLARLGVFEQARRRIPQTSST